MWVMRQVPAFKRVKPLKKIFSVKSGVFVGKHLIINK